MFKRLFLVIVLALLCLPAVGARAGTQDFTIKSFEGDYFISRGEGGVADLRVSEKIVAEFPNFDQNHGILRAIPQSYQGHTVELLIQKVTDDHGNALAFSTYGENGNLVVKIGDADKYVHGEQGYIVDYTARGVSLNLADHQEFYWDINGDQWQQPFGLVEARVHIPADLVGSLQDQRACYTGAAGSTQSNCSFTYQDAADGGRTITFTSKPLEAAQTLTVVLGFKKDTFAVYTPSAGQVLHWAGFAASIVVLPLLTLGWVVRRWLQRGRDPQDKNAVVPQYLQPKEASVLVSSEVLKEGPDPKAISATIIDLAVRHYFKIYEIKEDKMFAQGVYEVELVRSPEDLRPEERQVVDALFGSTPTVGARINLNDLKTKLATKAQSIGRNVEAIATAANYFNIAPGRAKMPYLGAGFLLLVGGFILFASGAVAGFAIGMFVSGVVLLAASQVMPARTHKGVELRNYLHGLQMYMKLAEADRLKVLQSPQGELTQKVDVGNNTQLVSLYEKLLPYAMLFGLEQDWAKTMAPLYQQQPDWYAGNSAFNAAWFASSLGNFSAVSAASFAPPSSSSSSGFSGGSSGGGGGGGGGGGW